MHDLLLMGSDRGHTE